MKRKYSNKKDLYDDLSHSDSVLIKRKRRKIICSDSRVISDSKNSSNGIAPSKRNKAIKRKYGQTRRKFIRRVSDSFQNISLSNNCPEEDNFPLNNNDTIEQRNADNSTNGNKGQTNFILNNIKRSKLNLHVDARYKNKKYIPHTMLNQDGSDEEMKVVEDEKEIEKVKVCDGEVVSSEERVDSDDDEDEFGVDWEENEDNEEEAEEDTEVENKEEEEVESDEEEVEGDEEVIEDEEKVSEEDEDEGGKEQDGDEVSAGEAEEVESEGQETEEEEEEQYVGEVCEEEEELEGSADEKEVTTDKEVSDEEEVEQDGDEVSAEEEEVTTDKEISDEEEVEQDGDEVNAEEEEVAADEEVTTDIEVSDEDEEEGEEQDDDEANAEEEKVAADEEVSGEEVVEDEEEEEQDEDESNAEEEEATVDEQEVSGEEEEEQKRDEFNDEEKVTDKEEDMETEEEEVGSDAEVAADGENSDGSEEEMEKEEYDNDEVESGTVEESENEENIDDSEEMENDSNDDSEEIENEDSNDDLDELEINGDVESEVEGSEIELGDPDCSEVENKFEEKTVARERSDGTSLPNEPYILHFSKCMSKNKAREIEDRSRWFPKNSKWPILGYLAGSFPKVDPVVPKKSKLLLEEEIDTDLPPIGKVIEPPPQPTRSISNCFIEESIVKRVTSQKFSAFQSEILTILSNYIDFYYPNSDHEKWEKIQLVYSIHCVNHVLKANQLIAVNDDKSKDIVKMNGEVDSSCCDQGFTKPTVLILVPFKNTAYKVIKRIIGLLKLKVKNKKRFEQDFGPPEDSDKIKKKINKPEDYQKTFVGDINEDFKIGLKINKKELKLYSEFFDSNIIVASPLGLRFTLEVEENPEAHAFLSSIEVLVMDQADIFLMQNWEHVMIIRDALNKVPKNFHKFIPDFNRVRRWCVDGLASYYRQTIVFTSTLTDYNQAFFWKTKNLAGKMQVMNPPRSILSDVKVKAELVFLRVPTDDSVTYSNPDSQFDHFVNHLLPLLQRKNLSHTLIYVPDYCDYIRLVSYFKEDGGSSVATINEYMMEENEKVAKVRSLFFEGVKKYLIYTERFHFYRRYIIKGIKHIVFYELPTFPLFFSEICNFMQAKHQNRKDPPSFEPNNIFVPFQKFDESKLLNTFGLELTTQILSSNKSIHKCDVGS